VFGSGVPGREFDQSLLGERLIHAVGQRHRLLPELIGHYSQRLTGTERFFLD
jgi:hypothetical protein